MKYRNGYILGALLSLSYAALAEENSSIRATDQKYLDSRQSRNSAFRTLPIGQLNPSPEHAIFSVNYYNLDAEVTNKQVDSVAPVDESLGVRGESLRPFLGYLGEHFGLGIIADLGQGHVQYRDRVNGIVEHSSISHGGLGAQVLANPLGQVKPLGITAHASSRYLGVQHRYKSSEIDWLDQEYNVLRSEIGLNMRFQFVSFFAVIPWVNGTHSKIINDKEDSQLLPRDLADKEIFWQPGYYQDYGLDLAFRFSKFDIHVGNLIDGIFADQKSGDQSVTNRSYSVSLTFEAD